MIVSCFYFRAKPTDSETKKKQKDDLFDDDEDDLFSTPREEKDKKVKKNMKNQNLSKFQMCGAERCDHSIPFFEEKEVFVMCLDIQVECSLKSKIPWSEH